MSEAGRVWKLGLNLSFEWRKRFMTIGIIVAIVAVLWIWGSNAARNTELKRMEQIRLNYANALDYLAENPEDPQARILCLETGRLSYEIEMPDTYTEDGDGNTFDHKNNASSREASIQSDIEAKIGHLKHPPPSHFPPLNTVIPPAHTPPTIAGQLKELMDLHKEGGLSIEEFKQLKQKLISGAGSTPPPIPKRKAA